jgi:hypothetical protein
MCFKPSPGANVRKSRHVTGKNVSDSDSDMEVTLHGGRGAKGGTGVGNSTTTPGAGSSVSKKKSTSVLFPPVRKEIAGLQPIEKRMCPMVGCDSSGHLGKFVKKTSCPGDWAATFIRWPHCVFTCVTLWPVFSQKG